MMVLLTITKTGKTANPRDKYSIFDEEEKTFRSLKDAFVWLKEQYGKCKRSKMYRDHPDGQGRHCGYIYGFRNSDISHPHNGDWLQRDWVSFYLVEPITL